MTPLVSVIMPARNAERTIRMAIDSVRRQSVDCWELVISDDASTDTTVEIVDTYQDDPRITLLRAHTSGGAARARNAAIEAARGRYIAFLDSDDLWLPDKLALQLAVGDHPVIY